MNLKEKYELICQVLSGQGLRVVAIVSGINSGQLYQWVHKYKTLGYILESKIIQNFLNLYPPLKSYCVLKSAPVLEFKGPELAWNSLLFIYDSKQASIRLNISF